MSDAKKNINYKHVFLMLKYKRENKKMIKLGYKSYHINSFLNNGIKAIKDTGFLVGLKLSESDENTIYLKFSKTEPMLIKIGEL